MTTDAELEAVGLYYPNGPYASERLQLLRYLMDLGASLDDLVANREELPGLATVLVLRDEGSLTFDEVVDQTEMSADEVRQIVRAAGFPEPGPTDRVFPGDFVSLCKLGASAKELFGEEATLQLVRVMGSAMARVADAFVSFFIANIEPLARQGDPVGLKVAQANVEALALFPQVDGLLDFLLRQHLIAVRRGSDSETLGGYERRHLCVGFVDLVGSTALAGHLSMDALGRILSQFENVTTDLVTAAGGRVVKFIGDEALFTVSDDSTGCRIALDLAATFAGHSDVPPVRVGVASGEVMQRDGDVFGPVVNLAARAAKIGDPGTVSAPMAVAQNAGMSSDSIGLVQLRGFDPMEFCRLRPTER